MMKPTAETGFGNREVSPEVRPNEWPQHPLGRGATLAMGVGSLVAIAGIIWGTVEDPIPKLDSNTNAQAAAWQFAPDFMIYSGGIIEVGGIGLALRGQANESDGGAAPRRLRAVRPTDIEIN